MVGLKSRVPLRPLAAVAALTLLSACAQPFQARVQSYQMMPPVQGQSFVVVPGDPKRQPGLEFQTYADLVAREMVALGFVPAANAEGADLKVLFDFGAGPGRERLATRPSASASFGWGWGGSRAWGRHPLWWGSFYDPFWGPGWAQNEVYSFTVYPTFVEVDILRAADQKPLFEGRAETTTRVNDMPATLPKLVTAMFKDFPGEPARSTVVEVPARR